MKRFETVSSILMLTSSLVGITCGVVFMLIVASHRRCQTTTGLLVLNSVIAGIISNCISGSQSIYQLLGDGNDALCILRGYLLYSTTGLLYHTLFVQGLHRFFVTVFATRRYLQSGAFILVIVIVQWLISGSFVLPILLDGRIRYNPGSRVCLIAVNDSFAFLYIGGWVYFFSMTVIIGIYMLILRHMKVNSIITIAPNRKAERRRQRREIRLYCRILILIGVLFVMGVPYCFFYALSMIDKVTPVPPYADRICFLAISIGYTASIFLSFISTSDVWKIFVRFMIGKRDNTRRQRVHCTAHHSFAVYSN